PAPSGSPPGPCSNHGRASASTSDPCHWDDVVRPPACGDRLRRSWLKDRQEYLRQEIIDDQDEDAGGDDGARRRDADAFGAAGGRGVTSFLIGSVPSVLSASICSVTRIDPSGAAIPDPTLPATIKPASTGPSSRTIDPAIRRPI